jgi:carbon-monoxide dehydrogenase small subunit
MSGVGSTEPTRSGGAGSAGAGEGISLTVNGATHEVESGLLTPLLDVLREELGITGPKAGCHQGGCGACTVLVDGEPRRSCLLPVAYADGGEITTVEGLGAPEDLSTIQQAFIHHYAAQCGFCTSGMMLAAQAYVSRGGTDDREAIQDALGGHVCRCTGYSKIIDAVAAAARGESFDLSETAVGKYTTLATGGAE